MTKEERDELFWFLLGVGVGGSATKFTDKVEQVTKQKGSIVSVKTGENNENILE